MIGGHLMTVKVSSIGLKGLEGYRVQVEVRIKPGTESVVIVGLPDASVKESRERVIAALGHFDADTTDQKVVINLSPSEQKKNGPLFDLAIAVAALKELGVLKAEILIETAFIGALSLDGMVVEAEGDASGIIISESVGIKASLSAIRFQHSHPYASGCGMCRGAAYRRSCPAPGGSGASVIPAPNIFGGIGFSF